MHTSVVRVQNVFGFFTTVAFAIAALIAFSDLLAPRVPKATLSMRDVQVFVALTPPLPSLHQSNIPQRPWQTALLQHQKRRIRHHKIQYECRSLLPI